MLNKRHVKCIQFARNLHKLNNIATNLRTLTIACYS